MIWLLTILSIFILVFSYILFAPFYLEIDSSRSLFGIRFHHLARGRLLITDSSLKIDLRIAGWTNQIALLTQKERKEKPIVVKRKGNPRRISFSKMKAMLKSFKVNKCYLNLDLENAEWNGILFPAFFWMSRVTGKKIQINFLGANEIKLEIENNIARILWAFIFK